MNTKIFTVSLRALWIGSIFALSGSLLSANAIAADDNKLRSVSLSEADHHLIADTVHTLPPAIAWLFPSDSRKSLTKIAIYGTEAFNVRNIHDRHIRVGNGQAKPIGYWRIVYDINDDGLEDLVFVVNTQKLKTDEADRFLVVTGHTSTTGSKTFHAAAPLGASSNLATELFFAVAEGVTGGLTHTAAGYALSALGIGEESSEPVLELSEIVAELSDISNTIAALGTELNSSLNLILTEIQRLDCNNQFNIIASDIAQITTWSNILQEWTMRTANGIPPPSAMCSTPDIENCFETFVVDVLAGTSSGEGVQNRLTSIHTELAAGGGLSGLLATCIVPMGQPVASTLDDRNYYAKVQDLVHYFYGIQVQAMNIYAEARHYRAWQAYVSDGFGDPGVDEAPEVCNNAPLGSQAGIHCALVKTELNRVYSRLQTQFAIAGAPYSQGKLVMLNGSNYLWPLNLDDFRANDGFTCQTPLTANFPCGTPAGTSHDKYFFTKLGGNLPYGGFGSTGFNGYFLWQTARASQWQELLGTTSHGANQTLAAVMKDNLGFSTNVNRIFLTNDIVTTRGTNVVRWLDTNFSPNGWHAVGFPPWGGIDSFKFMYTNSGDQRFTNNCVFNGQSSFVNNNTPTGFFYHGYLQQSSFGDDGQPCELFHPGHEPGGFVQSENNIQLRYPLLDVSRLPCGQPLLCGANRSDVNPAGVPSMCGADFDAYFEDRVPMPEGFQFPGC